MFKEDFSLSKVNIGRLLKTISRSIKKSYFYLAAEVPYSLTSDLIRIEDADIEKFLKNRGRDLKDIILLDAKIRFCDDVLDNKMSRMRPKPISSMKKYISSFEKEVPEAHEVAKLFRKEIAILSGKYSIEKMKLFIKELIEVRPSDFFLLVEKIILQFGTKLAPEDYAHSFEFYKNFQRLRDLLDDIMSIEEDVLKNDYNSIVVGKKAGISYHFFEEIILEKLSLLKEEFRSIHKHPNKNLFSDTIFFWEEQYSLLFKRLLVDYYVNLDEFRKSYFLIKQV